MAEGQLIFQSDAGYAVLGAGNVTHVDIILRRASPATSSVNPRSQNLRGMYSYMADAGWFVECRSGVRLSVAQEGENALLEAAYSRARGAAGASAGDGVPMLATVEGRVEDRPPMEGSGLRPTLIVEKFVSLAPEGCSGPSSTAQLENTYWKLMALKDSIVETPEGAREIHLVLNSEGKRVSGFAGCNRISGGYGLEGDKITFGALARTMMACATGMEIERQFNEALSRVAGWKISGETLQLTDAHGATIATFESRYLK
jgi:heat shock protein HslJ